MHNGQDYLLESYEFTYLTSGRDLLIHHVMWNSNRDIVVLANPDYDARPSSKLPQLTTLPIQAQGLYAQLGEIRPLPGTGEEARQLMALLPGATLLQGEQANESAVRHLHAPLLLHIATHGVFLDGPMTDPGTSRSDANGDARLERHLSPISTEQGVIVPRQVEQPLSRSALLLAGAAHAEQAPDHTQDGLLTGEEVATLDLADTELVVLSACDSGRGGLQTGEGVYGLRRAFLVAGAETLVTSLWQVADNETGSLMVQYYKNLRARQGRVAAMREAARFIRKQEGTGNPYYWAPFIVVGSDSRLHFPSRP